MQLQTLLSKTKNNLSFQEYCQEFSPYLSDLYKQQSDWLYENQEKDFEGIFEIFTEIFDAPLNDTSQDKLMSLLRLVKKRATLVVSLYDIFGELSVPDITNMLSKVADLLISVAFKASCLEWIKRGKLPISSDRLEEGSGLIVVAMGKLGAMELNFSSDIDICVFFDPQAVQNVDEHQLYDGYIRVVKSAVKLLSERTKDGYIYRVDLRLRPDPASTKVAVPIQAAEYYYERSGQNWERAAWIKGRFVYGDPVSWMKLQTMLRPFIWRRNLDYAAIQDIHSIKRQIHSHYGHDDIKVYNHNVKLGKGGIREIELFVQTQQLIGGGRDVRLRSKGTLATLKLLVDKNWITADIADTLSKAYCLFRKVEHRLQMVNDAQTHEIPPQGEAFDKIAQFCDFENSESFIKTMLDNMNAVHQSYQQLFENQQPLSSTQGSLVFTGVDYHPDTVAHLEKIGFENPKTVIDIISNWHKGHYKAMRSSKARELLTELVPTLIKKISQSHSPDKALLSLDKFLENLPSGVAFFSYLNNSPRLMELLLDIMTQAPNLAEHLSHYPLTFDALMDRSFFTPPQSEEDFAKELRLQIRKDQSYERIMEITRRFNREQKFRIGVLVLRNIITPAEASLCFTYLAHLSIRTITKTIEAQMCEKYQISENNYTNICVCAMGSTGAFEMHANSDLDLIMIYDADATFVSDHIDMQTFYTKIGQRIISALTILTPEGSLYQVDMRLRPSGNSGPLVTSYQRFIEYQTKEAHIWEHCALTKIYPICGSKELLKNIVSKTHKIITTHTDIAKVRNNIKEMRQKLSEQRRPLNIWDIKQAQGGLFEIIFITQFLILTQGHKIIDSLSSQTYQSLELFKAHHILSDTHFNIIMQAWKLYHNLLHIMAIAKLDMMMMDKTTSKIKSRICEIMDIDDFSQAETKLQQVYNQVLNVYEEVLG